MGSLLGKGTGHAMEPKPLEGKLTAIVYVGAVGYSWLPGKDKEGAHSAP